MGENDPKLRAVRQMSEELDLGLWYKDREHFIHSYDEFVKNADISKMGDNKLVQLYVLAQDMLEVKLWGRDEMGGYSKESGYPQQERNELNKKDEERFAFLGQMGKEIDKRYREGKIKTLPPTMEQRGQ